MNVSIILRSLKVIIIILTVLLALSYLIKRKTPYNRKEKISTFECGFEPDHKIRTRFSLRFFIITIIFLVFDVELTVIIPLPTRIDLINFRIFYPRFVALFLILAGGLIFEWYQGAIKWRWFYI